MHLKDNSLEYAFSGDCFTNVGEKDCCIFDFSNLKIKTDGVHKTEDSCGAESIVLRLNISSKRTTDMWICYSMLSEDSENFVDDYVQIEPYDDEYGYDDQYIDIPIDNCEIAYSNNRRAMIHFVIEDGRRRILGRCDSLCVDYNIFSGRYRCKKIDKFQKGQRRENRELDIRVNKIAERQFFANDWSYMYIHKTLPIVVTNCTARNRSFLIDNLEFDGSTPEEVIGRNALGDAITIGGWESYEMNVVLPFDENASYDAELFFEFTDIATNNHYLNRYTYDDITEICKIDYSFVFLHDKFEC